MARQFDGIDDYLVSGANVDLSGTSVITLSFWLWWDSFASDDDVALELTANYATNNGGFLVIPNESGSGGFAVGLHDAAGFNVEYITRPSGAAWHHYAIILNLAAAATDKITFYVDGVLTASTQTSSANVSGNFTSALLYFMSRAGTSLFGDGRMAEPAIYASALSGANITTLADGARADDVGTPFVYWPVEGTTSPEPESMSGNTATVSGAVFVAHPDEVTNYGVGGGVNTRNKRASVLGVGSPWRTTYALADGLVEQADRQQSAGSYAGVLSTSVPAPSGAVAISVTGTGNIFVPWLEMALDSGTQYFGPVGRAVDDPSTYYGGFKDDQVISFGHVTRALSEDGQYRAPSFASTVSDTARALRALSLTTTFKGRTALIRIIDHANRALLRTPMIAARGMLRSPQWTRDLTVAIQADDPLSREFGGAGFDPQVPRRLITRDIFTGLATDHEAIGKAVPIIYGDFSTAVDGQGLIPVIPLDTETIADAIIPGLYGRLLICGHACKEVSTTIYVNGKSYNLIGPGHVMTLIPGSARWNLVPSLASAVTRTIGGEYFSIMYINAAERWWKEIRDGKSELMLLVKGVEDSTAGDGSGILITSVHKQLRHFLINYVLGNQTTTPLATPQWASGDLKLDTGSFDTADTKATARLSGGYPSAAYLNEQRNPVDLVADFCRCGDVEIGQTREQRLAVTMFDKSDVSIKTFAPSGGDVNLNESVEIAPDDAQHFNKILYAWGEKYLATGYTADNAYVRDDASITTYGMTLPSPKVELPFIRSATVAQNIAEHRLRRSTHPPNRVTLSTDLVGLDVELGRVISLTDKGGPSSTGWSARKMVVRSVDVDLDQLKTTFDLMDHDQVPSSLAVTAYAGETVTPEDTVKVKDRPTKTGKVPGGHLERDLGGDPDTPVISGTYRVVLQAKRASVNKEDVGNRVMVLRLWRKTSASGTSVKMRLVKANSSTVIAEGTTTTGTNWQREDIDIQPDDWSEGDEDYELQIKGSNGNNGIFGYGKLITN